MKKQSKAEIKLMIFGIIKALIVISAIFAPYICPYDPYEQDLSIAYQSPNAMHLMGTDVFGRDMLSRIIIGGRVSILSTLLLVLSIALFGTLIGIICGYFEGKIDTVIMRLSDSCLAFPGLVFALAVAAILGGGIVNAVIALAAISWPKYSRVARGLTLSIKNSTFVAASRLAGSNLFQIIVRHILPNILGPILVTATLDIGTMMMELAGLSFLGLGAQPPVAEWGSMMSQGRSMLQTYPWVVLSPGLAIFISVAAFNLFGDAFRDVIDPKSKAIN